MAERYDVVVIGSGPAGLTAAHAAARQGVRVGLVDAQALPGGQVWRHDVRFSAPAFARRCMQATLEHIKIDWLPQTRVVGAEPGRLLVEDPRSARWLKYGALVLATGAREVLLPFPGWTLPGVTGAGGLQALAKQGWPLAGKCVVVAGSGPLLLAAAATARRHGARVLAVFEQAERAAMLRFTRGLWRWPARVLQAAALRTQLAGVPYHFGSVVTAAQGEDVLREIEVSGPHRQRRIACDQLAVGFGLAPNVELARMLGCQLEAEGAQQRVRVDARQHTSVPTVYAAGEVCGIGGRDSALIEGAIAGLAATGARTGIASLQRRRAQARAFARQLRETFAIGERVRALAQPDTLVCRCEDVTLGALDAHVDARGAKLATRCGMGPCQGRICATALAELGRAAGIAARPPLFPARLETLALAPADGVAPSLAT